TEHPSLRIRKKGNSFEITKKQPLDESDSSEQSEHTIKVTEEEYNSLIQIKGKKVSKIRYDYNYNGINAEIGVFQDELKGLVLVDVEFTDSNSKDAFKMPDCCLLDVTQDDTFAGGLLCGKKYKDIEDHLKKLGYSPIK
ncbi:CYTH domain-containing protein, partial [Staphylococcus aureus]|uniref:CYTH domain-containing protein n=1 Tax=Staphylococcus aureus TaxID=1280 RepID=UPI0039BE23EA